MDLLEDENRSCLPLDSRPVHITFCCPLEEQPELIAIFCISGTNIEI